MATGSGAQTATDSLARKVVLIDHLTLIPIFTGEDVNFSFADFQDKINDLASYLAWDDLDKYFVVRNRLGGQAAGVVKNYGNQINDFKSLQKVLTERYHKEKDPARVLQEFLNYQQHSVPVSEFVARATSLSYSVVRAQGLDEISAENSREILLKSMLLANLRPEIRRGVISKNPATVKELIEYASLEERGFESIRSNPVGGEFGPKEICAVEAPNLIRRDKSPGGYADRRIEPTEGQQFKDFSQKIEKQISDLTEQVTRLAMGRQSEGFSHKACFVCNQVGHFARNCRLRPTTYETRTPRASGREFSPHRYRYNQEFRRSRNNSPYREAGTHGSPQVERHARAVGFREKDGRSQQRGNGEHDGDRTFRSRQDRDFAGNRGGNRDNFSQPLNY